MTDPLEVVAGVSAASAIVAANLAVTRWRKRGTATPCPLCEGTPRESLTYEPDQLAEHARSSHDFEEMYDWTRTVANEFMQDHLVGLLDAAHDVVQALTTTTFQQDEGRRARLALPPGSWAWHCDRCGTSCFPFLTETAAMEHRLDTHRCPL